MSVYDVTIRVPDEEGLTAIVSAMRSSCTLRAVVSVGNSTKAKPSSKQRVSNGGGRIRGADLIASIFKKKPTRTTKEIRDAFIEAGFAANSASPQISAAKQRGEIKPIGDNTYKLV